MMRRKVRLGEGKLVRVGCSSAFIIEAGAVKESSRSCHHGVLLIEGRCC